jgi:thymidine kinase
MAKLYFNYAAMNAGKSTILLQASHNYIERGMSTLLLTARLDDRSGKKGSIVSRIGISADAELFASEDDLLAMITKKHRQSAVNAVLVDEAQFLSREQVWALARVTDELGIPVMCYGLRTDFQGKLFPGSAELLAIADDLREIKTVCWCGKKATMVIRLDAKGRPIEKGDQIEIGGNDKYISLCRKHWMRREMRAKS